MILKDYQREVVDTLHRFLTTAQQNRHQTRQTQQKVEEARALLPEEYRNLIPVGASVDWVRKTFADLALPLTDAAINGLGESYPRVCVKVPTGGGKTLLAVETIREYQNEFARRRTGLVVWVVPSETIYTQTVARLRDKGQYLRQLLDQCSGGHTLILEKGQRLTGQDIAGNLVVLFVMIQSISRINGKDALKVFQDSGGYDSFFPPDGRHDLHGELLTRVPNLDVISDVSRASFPLVRTSLGNAIRLTNPLIIIDEIHKVYSDAARATISGLNPSLVVGFSATPKSGMNIAVTITGLQLKAEEMVKLDMHILPPTSTATDDRTGGPWQDMIRQIQTKRDSLEEQARLVQEQQGLYVRPTALIQVESTGANQRGKAGVHSLDVKDYLLEIGVPADQIAIKTSAQNDIEDVDLFARSCPVRYIITKEALKEGWDFSFTYILGIIPNVGSTNSLTQLVGRILRQPYARKFGVAALDESYVYFSKGRTSELLDKIRTSFRDEGLEDLMQQNVKVAGTASDAATKTVYVKPEFQSTANAFYLPVWMMVEPVAGGQVTPQRRFSYELDIRPELDFARFTLSSGALTTLEKSLSTETRERQIVTVSLDAASHATFAEQREELSAERSASLSYLTRRVNEIVENPFLSRVLANQLAQRLDAHIGAGQVSEQFSFLTAELVHLLNVERLRQEEQVFEKLVAANQLVLAVSDDAVRGYCLPAQDVITVDRVPNFYKYYLYDDVDSSSMNSLEKSVGEILDRQQTILWWFRNKVSRGWYAIQGWRRHKIRPDFVAAKKRADGSLELVYVLESKGEMLLGNSDTTYKKQVLDKMTSVQKQTYQTELDFGVLNEAVEFYLIEQGREDAQIRTLF